MFSLKNKIFILLCLLPLFCAHAERPKFLVDEKSILAEFRGSLRSKLGELSQNYIIRRTTNTIVWSSGDSIDCEGATRPARSPLASLVMTRVAESVMFDIRGCNEKTVLREIFDIESDSKITLATYLAGDLPSGKIKRYVLQDNQRINLLEWRALDNASVFYFLSSRFLDLYKESNRWQYKAIGYKVGYSNGGTSFNVDMVFDDTRLSVEWHGDEVRVLDTNFKPISINSFLTAYSQTIQGATLSYTNSIIQGIINETLPSTEFVASAGANSRLLDEMRLAYTRLLNNLELNLVKQYVQDLITAIESGLLQITDNRPEQK